MTLPSHCDTYSKYLSGHLFHQLPFSVMLVCCSVFKKVFLATQKTNLFTGMCNFQVVLLRQFVVFKRQLGLASRAGICENCYNCDSLSPLFD